MFKPRPNAKKKNRRAVKRKNKIVSNFWDIYGEKDMHGTQHSSCDITIQDEESEKSINSDSTYVCSEESDI